MSNAKTLEQVILLLASENEAVKEIARNTKAFIEKGMNKWNA